MLAAVQRELPGTAVFIATAAVADYRPAQVAPRKIKKTAPELSLELTRTTDILAGVAARPDRPFVVGFAAETDAVEQHAREKMLRKNLDMIAANEVSHTKGFDCEDNALLVLWRGGQAELPSAPKLEIARDLTALIAERMRAAGVAPPARDAAARS
jgi:phosphopantothenoylcysteine decarboxylase/phosphopantothenate--cysteine ligase